MNRDFIMPFGKYKGETLEQIYVDDRGYFDWAEENIENDDIREKFEQCRLEMKNVKIH